MERLKQVEGHYLDLKEYDIDEKFYVYELGNYDFSDNLVFSENKGVYIFTLRDIVSELDADYGKQMYFHTLIYCGRSTELDDRFYNHFHKEEIKKKNADRICICFCNTDEETEELEKKVLATFQFPVNEKDNDNPKYPNITKVREAF